MDTDVILKKVEGVVAPVISGVGFELVECELIFDQGRWVLRLYIDNRSRGITLEDCSQVSRALEGVLDVEDLIPYRYVLEVSSPGLNRPLRRKEDFIRFAGECVKIKTKESIEGRSNYKGILNGMDGAEILVTVDGTLYRIPYDLLAKARIEPRFK